MTAMPLDLTQPFEKVDDQADSGFDPEQPFEVVKEQAPKPEEEHGFLWNLVHGKYPIPSEGGTPGIDPTPTELSDIPTLAAPQIPRVESPSQDVLPSAAAAIWNTGAGAANFLLSPAGPPTIVAGMVPGVAPAMGLGFAALMAKEGGTQLGKGVGEGDLQTALEGVGELGLGALGAKGGFEAAANRIIPARALAKAIEESPLKTEAPNANPKIPTQDTSQVSPTNETPAPQAAEAVTGDQTQQALTDRQRYEQIQSEISKLADAPDLTAPEAQAKLGELWKENEAIKSKYNGMPPPKEEPFTIIKPKVAPPAETGPGMVGMGGAVEGEVGAGAGGDTYGIAQRVREARAEAGAGPEVQPGQGIAAPDSVEHGRELLTQGRSAENTLSAFEKTKALSADDMAVTRAHGEQLAADARAAEEKFGTESPEHKAALQKLFDWDSRTKPMQTEWHKMGQAQQGETDIDTGSFTGLARAFKQDTGKDFTPKQAGTAKRKAKTVKDAGGSAGVAKEKLNEQIKADASDAEKRASAAASRTVRNSAVRVAEEETKARVAAEKLKQAQNEVQRKAAQKALEAAQKRVRDAAVESAKAANEARVNPERTAWQKVGDYLTQGATSFDEIRSKVATDLGISVKKVTDLMLRSKRAKYLADEAWEKQRALRDVQQQAKRWLKAQGIPGYQRALATLPRAMFSLKVGFHGTVALGTHAPMVAFQPQFWSTYVRDFGTMYKMVNPIGGRGQAYYEMQVQDLIRRPNYVTAQRAGLVNDPFTYEDFNNPDISLTAGRIAGPRFSPLVKSIAEKFNQMTGMGNRGYSVLKILRQDMFDQHWNNLPRTAQIPEMASAIADAVNHATGVVKGRAPKGSNIALFAPRLEASRAMWLVGDPLRAADTFLRWNKSSEAERMFALNQVKEKAWVAGTLFGLLAFNQGMLSATGSKQKVNFFDPMHSDWMKFKGGDMTFSYGNPMLTMARLPVRLYQIRESSGGKLRNVIYPDESTYSVLGEYGRSQMSPFASLATTLWLKGDWQNRPLPTSDRPVPARLRAQGVKPYTWTEFWSEQVAPIPAEEAMREVWKTGMGMSDEQVLGMRKFMATLAVMSATGARLTDDVPYKKPSQFPSFPTAPTFPTFPAFAR